MCPIIQRFSINFQNGTHLQCLQETNSVRVFAAVSSNSSVTRVKVTILYQHYHKYENLKIKCLLWIHFQLRYSEESRQNNSLAVTSFRASKWRREKKNLHKIGKVSSREDGNERRDVRWEKKMKEFSHSPALHCL